MSIKRKVVSRAGSLAAAVAVALGALVPVIVPMVSAAQVQTRSIQISDSTPSRTGVSYQVTFTPATTGAQSFIIDFCSNSSIISGSCTAPAGMDASTSIGFTSGTGTANWALGTGSTSQVRLTKNTGANLGTTAIDFTLTGITNSSTLGTFWARVYTFSNTTYGTYSAAATPGNYVDYGGFALSTAELINITATVMETLTFCTSKAAPTAGCTGTTSPNLILGHGTPQVLDGTQADTDTAYFQISTNALTGAIVRMKSHNVCANGGLSRDGGTTCPIAGQGGTPDPFSILNVAQFGLNVGAGTGGIGAVNPIAPYATASNYALDGANVTSTYGDDIANTNGTASANVNTLLTFAAQASVTTPAGTYSVNESLIATGTF